MTVPRNSASTTPVRHSLLIAGNGESAWTAAALLATALDPADWRIVVVSGGPPLDEFPAESTRPEFLALLANLNVEEHDVLRQCNGTFRLATWFTDWREQGHEFWIPCTPLRAAARRLDLIDAWSHESVHGRIRRPLHSYSLNWAAALTGRGPMGIAGPSPLTRDAAFAVHVDSRLLTRWLRKLALQRGVEEIPEVPVSSVPRTGGGCSGLVTSTGVRLAGDFFLIATAAESPLMRALDSDLRSSQRTLQSWADQRPPLRVETTRTVADGPVPACSRITAVPDGWILQTPLASTTLVSRVSCDQSDVEDANGGESGDAAFAIRRLRPGHRESWWRHNVLTLGSAACQLDPVTNSSRLLLQQSLELLLELFPEPAAPDHSAAVFNKRMTQAACEQRDFARLHALPGGRRDPGFWRRCTDAPLSDSLRSRLSVFESCGQWDSLPAGGIAEIELWHLLAGCGRRPRWHASAECRPPESDPSALLQSAVQSNDRQVRLLDRHEDVLRIIHGGSGTQSPDQTRQAS